MAARCKSNESEMYSLHHVCHQKLYQIIILLSLASPHHRLPFLPGGPPPHSFSPSLPPPTSLCHNSLTISSSSASMRSYADRDTQNTMAVTPSKQWIHFLRSDLWPPTSNILHQSQSEFKSEYKQTFLL